MAHEHDHDHDAHAHHDHDDHEHHEHHAHGQPLDYANAVRAFRADKDAHFRSNPHSPIPPPSARASRASPTSTSTRRSRSRADLGPYAGTEPTAFQIPTSDGRLRPAERAGTFTFEVDGTACRLTAYVFEGGDTSAVFVPFLDRTSGTETYGAGRYLDLEVEDDGTYALDFNLAYHPSCVYDARFSCPLTPAENRLPVRIEAGELPGANA
jgi:uncharacterized protein (DUF1684 family)